MSKKEKEMFMASKSTLWLLFLPIATVTKVSLIDQIVKEMIYDADDDKDDD